MTLAETAQIISSRFRRLAIALSLATALTWIGTFVLLRADASPVIACVLATALGVAVLMQVLAPGAGVALRDRAAPSSSPAVGRAETQSPVLTPSSNETSVLEVVREEVAAVLHLESAEDVQPDSLFRTLGADSLQTTELQERLERVAGFQLPLELVYQQPTVAALAHFLWLEIQARAEFGSCEGALRDAITGLPTRGYLMARLAELEGESQRRNAHFALAVLELRTATGEEEVSLEAVTTAARRLSRAVRGGDTLVRLGPSRFAIALSLAESDVHEIYAAGARLVNAFSPGADPRGALRVSVGVAIHENGMLGGELLRAAVAALPRATGGGDFGVGVANRKRFPHQGRGGSTEADPVTDEEDAP